MKELKAQREDLKEEGGGLVGSKLNVRNELCFYYTPDSSLTAEPYNDFTRRWRLFVRPSSTSSPRFHRKVQPLHCSKLGTMTQHIYHE